MDTAELPPKLTEWLQDEASMQLLTHLYGGAYAKLAPLYARSLKRAEVEALQDTDTAVMLYMYSDPKRCLRTIAESNVASIAKVKNILEWCRRHRDKANDTAAKEDELERSLWRSCRDAFSEAEINAWLETLPKRLADTVPEGEGPAADTHSAGKVAGSSASCVEREHEATAKLGSRDFAEGGLEARDEEQGTGSETL